MSKPAAYIIGPELYWLIMYGILIIMIKSTGAPAKSLDNIWINMTYIVPLILVPLSFSLYWIPSSVHKFFLLRMWVVGVVGAHLVLTSALESHSEGGPGVGTAYMLGIGLVFISFLACTIFVLIKFR